MAPSGGRWRRLVLGSSWRPLASVLLATGVELSMRMRERLELIAATAVGKIASCRANSRHLDTYY